MNLINYIKKYRDGGTPKDYNKMTLSERRKYITNWFKSKGTLGDIQIAAIVGNMVHESGNLLPTQKNLAGGGDYGLAQWNGSRKKKLLSQPNPHSLETQLNFAYDEVMGNIKGVWTNNMGGRSAFMNSTNLQEATKIFRADWERPHHTALHDDRRYNYAQQSLKDIDPNYQVELYIPPTGDTATGGRVAAGDGAPSKPLLPQEVLDSAYEGTFDWGRDGASEEVSIAQQYLDIKTAMEEQEAAEAEKERIAKAEAMRQELLQDEGRKEEFYSLMQQRAPEESKYTSMLSQGAPQIPAFRFQTDWYKPNPPKAKKGGVLGSILNKMQDGGAIRKNILVENMVSNSPVYAHRPLNKKGRADRTPIEPYFPQAKYSSSTEAAPYVDTADPLFEDVFEVFDITGISSHDDFRRAGAALREGDIGFGEFALESVGAIPLAGRAKPALKLSSEVIRLMRGASPKEFAALSVIAGVPVAYLRSVFKDFEDRALGGINKGVEYIRSKK